MSVKLYESMGRAVGVMGRVSVPANTIMRATSRGGLARHAPLPLLHPLYTVIAPLPYHTPLTLNGFTTIHCGTVLPTSL